MNTKSSPKKNGIDGSKKAKRRKYARSTPIARMTKRFSRAKEILDFSIEKIKTWSGGDKALLSVLDAAGKASSHLSSCIEGSEALAESGWTPPAKSMAVVYSKGDLVQIAVKYRKKYRSLYSQAIMNHLVVHDVSEVGKVVVKSEIGEGDEPPPKFFAAKSHLKRRSMRGSEQEESF